ncbi:MAG: hypothetical protein KA794_09955 [Candidatus Obscuribacter sp.]|jgi:GGDEF domain-containing protein|nr:hypothetical protein [Candidatus Obscuribacter sp.]MBP7577016.1 hypothetical protein [Candidatus Obscuribacter sp.]
MQPNAHIEQFKSDVASKLPGLVVLMNLADAKRRTCHLGYTVTDDDIEEFDTKLKSIANNAGVVSRISGVKWLALLPFEQLPLLQQLLDGFQKQQVIQIGWSCTGLLNCDKSKVERTVRATISRSIKCIYTTAKDATALSAVIEQLLANCYKVEPGEPIELSQIKGREGESWRCVSDYPSEDPFCPFCEGTRFDWDDGDDSVYSGSGSCQSCGAYVSISGIEELEG